MVPAEMVSAPGSGDRVLDVDCPRAERAPSGRLALGVVLAAVVWDAWPVAREEWLAVVDAEPGGAAMAVAVRLAGDSTVVGVRRIASPAATAVAGVVCPAVAGAGRVVAHLPAGVGTFAAGLQRDAHH